MMNLAKDAALSFKNFSFSFSQLEWFDDLYGYKFVSLLVLAPINVGEVATSNTLQLQVLIEYG